MIIIPALSSALRSHPSPRLPVDSTREVYDKGEMREQKDKDQVTADQIESVDGLHEDGNEHGNERVEHDSPA